MKSWLRCNRISFSYAKHKPVLQCLSLELPPGEIGCLMGPSGCGKTTLLRIIAGLEQVQAGTVEIDSVTVASKQSCLSPAERGVGIVFQDSSLFPNMTIEQNIRYGLRRLSRSDRETRYREMVDTFEVENLVGRYPHEISQGQQQRVALARALAPCPLLLLMDEPFANLDVKTKTRLTVEMRQIIKRQGITTLVVTHDQNEAFALADRVGIMNRGKLLQFDSPPTLYHSPADEYVAGFVGNGVFVDGVVLGDGKVSSMGMELQVRQNDLSAGTPVQLLIRPDDVTENSSSQYRAVLECVVFQGVSNLCHLKLPSGEKLLLLAEGRRVYREGDVIGVNLNIQRSIPFRKTANLFAVTE